MICFQVKKLRKKVHIHRAGEKFCYSSSSSCVAGKFSNLEKKGLFLLLSEKKKTGGLFRVAG